MADFPLAKVFTSQPRAKTTVGDHLRSSRGWDRLIGVQEQAGWIDPSQVFRDYSNAELEKLYETHPVIGACVDEIAQALPKAQLEIGTEVGGEWKTLDSHDTLDLLETPRPDTDRSELLFLWVSRAILTGQAWLWKIRNRAGNRLAELWPIPTSWVRRRSGGTPPLFEIHGQRDAVPADDLALLRCPRPASTIGGASPVRKALRDVQIDLERIAYLGDMFANLSLPGPVLKSERKWSAEQKEMIRHWFREQYGKGHRGEPLMLSGTGEFDMANPLEDLDWPGLTALVETRMCSALGVPPVLIHARAGIDRATYSNYETARRSFYTETLSNWWDRLADALTRALLRDEGETTLRFRFAYHDLPEFQEDEETRTNRTVKAFQAKVITLDEARIALGYDPATPDQLEELQQPAAPVIPLNASEEGEEAASE